MDDLLGTHTSRMTELHETGASMGERTVRGLIAASSVVCGAAVGILTNLLTGRWSVTLACGLIIAVICWASVEIARARRHSESSPTVHVIQRIRRVFGQVIGARHADGGPGVQVRQEVKTVERGAEVVGYDGSSDATRWTDGIQ
jgi:hypothetical protein